MYGFRLIVLLVVFSMLITVSALPAVSQEYLTASPDDIAWWQDARFGLFVHWGPVSLEGTEIGWSRGGERRGRRDTSTGEIPVDTYDNLYKSFNPTRFDANEWVEIAKSAGMKYLVFTTKHHDGFSMFDTEWSDYRITSPACLFGRDVVKELADACHEAGIRLGFYYSPVDWYHPDYRTANHERYVTFMHNQVRELCSNYGKLDILWFDGLGGSTEDWNSPPLFRMIRELQPHIIINDRAGLPADFSTPEQRVGQYNLDRPWESCITICRQWAWKPDDDLKSLGECIRTLVTCAGGDGNLLLNVGPMPDGRIEPRQVERLREIGGWLEKYGESIYGTRGGPVPPQSWGVTTRRDSTVYVHVLFGDDRVIALPDLDAKVISAELLSGLKVDYAQTLLGVLVKTPGGSGREIDTVIRLTLDREPRILKR